MYKNNNQQCIFSQTILFIDINTMAKIMLLLDLLQCIIMYFGFLIYCQTIFTDEKLINIEIQTKLVL